MTEQLKISLGQFSDKGRKEVNQDFHGVLVPKEPLLTTKGIAVVLADGISSSDVSQVASEASVGGFLSDYFCTSETWSVKKSAQRVLRATNSWLYSQSQLGQHRFNKDKGYVCTCSALILKSRTAHIFHVGDTRVYKLSDEMLEQLTDDHRLWVSEDKSYLSRALGISQQLDIDYREISVEQGDVFLLATDGVYEFVSDKLVIDLVNEHTDDLDKAAKAIVDEALVQKSDDNLTIQIVRVDQLPAHDTNEIYQQITALPAAPLLDPRMIFEGYNITREIHASSRSHIYLATDEESGIQVAIKIPSIDLRHDSAYLERFMMEEWIARRINSAHVLKPCIQTRKRNYLYVVTEFIEGQTLTQWMIDNPKPEIEAVRDIVEQIAKGLRAFHKMDMLHQDLRPENIMIDTVGTVKIIDFGSTRVAGITEMTAVKPQDNLLGTAQYMAPEYFLGEEGASRSDLFSLGVITYQMLTGKLPYGANVARCHSKKAQGKLQYQTILDDACDVPAWFDGVLKKSVHIDPRKRYTESSEFIYDLRHPNKDFLNKTRPPLMERNPVFFWKSTSFVLLLVVLFLLTR
jgi:serine/threonine protein phosphatase PrpC/predicted Ser/Thr protein kinase